MSLLIPPSSKLLPDAPSAVRSTNSAPHRLHTSVGELAVFQFGQGRQTIVFWPSLFTDHTMYNAQIAALQSEFRLILIDGPAHGYSGAQSAGANLQQHAQAAGQILDELGVSQAAFVGTSWGGLVGTHLAYQRPDLISALIALNTPFDVKAKHPELADKIVVWTARMFGRSPQYGGGVAQAFFSPQSLKQQPERIEAFKQRFVQFAPAALAAVARTVLLERASALPLLAALQCPLLIVAGSDDRNYAPALSRHAASLNKQAQLVEIAQSGHLSAVEAPEQVNALIRQTLAQLALV